ncbi:MAG: hypothetical protein COA79_23435 [Planctomycetota bacterium]|nr:MAG: hypothetical protein COA79_23435 [Planctomycetota bacterium]
MFNINDYILDSIASDLKIEIQKNSNRIPDPFNYFHGKTTKDLIIPENILMFYRSKTIADSTPSIHERFVLIYNFSGEGSVIIDNSAFRLKESEAILIYPHQYHVYADIAKINISWLFITFEAQNHGTLTERINATFKLSNFSMLNILFLSNYFISTKNQPSEETHASLLLANILQEISITIPIQELNKDIPTEKELSSSHLLIQQIIQFIHEDLTQAVSIDDVAQEVHFSPSHLRSKFKKIMGIGLGTYIRKTKIHKACLLIQNTSLTISQISQQCGFSSLYSFSRTFSSEMGHSPMTYKSTNSK